MQCIIKALDLFNGPTCCSAVVLTVAAFLLGALCACVLCKLTRSCACTGKRKVERRERPKDERPFEKRKPHPAPADGSVEIYVGNLSYDMTEDQLRKEFEAYGTVKSARLIINRFNGKSKGFGFVQMPNRAEAEKACAELNDKDIMGRKMKCNEAKNLI
jgi:RNA recognition motif-containing protein